MAENIRTKVYFDTEELAVIASYSKGKSRQDTIYDMMKSLTYTEDEAAKTLVRGAIAKLSVTTDAGFANLELEGADTVFE